MSAQVLEAIRHLRQAQDLVEGIRDGDYEDLDNMINELAADYEIDLQDNGLDAETYFGE